MPQTGRQQIINGTDGALSLTTAYITARLVEQYHDFFHGRHVTAVHLHKILFRHFHARRINHLSIDFNTPFRNQPVCHAARINATGCQEFIHADTSVFIGAILFFTHIL